MASSTTSVKEIYLILYNNALAVGWGMVWCLLVHFLVQSVFLQKVPILTALSNVYRETDGLPMMLCCSQLAALMEIVHVLLGLVRSPLPVTVMQVSSRMAALLALVYSTPAQSK
jgi:very-long-chain (3R)-3-hydroxyacyl-CoA dehydratase